MRAPSYRALDALFTCPGRNIKGESAGPRSTIVAAINCCKIASPAGGFGGFLAGGWIKWGRNGTEDGLTYLHSVAKSRRLEEGK